MLTLNFGEREKRVELWGINQSKGRLVKGKTMRKAIQQNGGRAPLLQIQKVLGEQEPSSNQGERTKWVIEFPVVFSKPRGPPPREQDHRIPLIPSSQPVYIKPYRYPYLQKQEIEKLVPEMLTQGIIQPSRSSYSSPFLLVKKHDCS